MKCIGSGIFLFKIIHTKLCFCYNLSIDISSWIINLLLSSPFFPSQFFPPLLIFHLRPSFLSSLTQLLILHHLCRAHSIFPSFFLLCAFPVCPLCSLFRHAACSPGGVGCGGEESSSLRSSPALCGQLLFVQPETQAGSAAASGRTLHRQVRSRCKHTLACSPNFYVSLAIASCFNCSPALLGKQGLFIIKSPTPTLYTHTNTHTHTHTHTHTRTHTHILH